VESAAARAADADGRQPGQCARRLWWPHATGLQLVAAKRAGNQPTVG